MNPISFPEQQKVLGAPVGWDEKVNGPCIGLPVAVIDGACKSVWEPTPQERAAIAGGANILLSVISGQTQPPVWLSLYPAAAQAEGEKPADDRIAALESLVREMAVNLKAAEIAVDAYGCQTPVGFIAGECEAIVSSIKRALSSPLLAECRAKVTS